MKIKDFRQRKIEDFGEKIGGAKKDLFSEYVSMITDIDNDALYRQPLQKIFPPPAYTKLVAEGKLSPQNAILLRYYYDKIPSKPRGVYSINSWMQEVRNVVELTHRILSTPESDNMLDEYIERTNSASLKLFARLMQEAGFPQQEFMPGPYEIHTDYCTGHYFLTKGKYIVKNQVTIPQAVEYIREQIRQKTAERKPKALALAVYQNRRSGNIFIAPLGKSDIILKDGFQTATEAHHYIREHRGEIEEIWNFIRNVPEERRPENRMRIGTDWRGGRNILSLQFGETFGFRGVEFGNWVNQDERQGALNDAYDALMDLASITNIFPKALSLNGELGLAFGARGSGKANAHYEPCKVVINLTKTRGAGSLAHEWFHALDNYFSRQRDASAGFMTAAPYPRNNDPTRLELLEAFRELMKKIGSSNYETRCSLLDRTKGRTYWASKEEMGARAFESFVVGLLAENGERNDYLANFKPLSEFIETINGNAQAIADRYPYPLDAESLEFK